MKPIEVRGEALVILFGSFTHVAVHCEPQYYKHIYGAIDPFQA